MLDSVDCATIAFSGLRDFLIMAATGQADPERLRQLIQFELNAEDSSEIATILRQCLAILPPSDDVNPIKFKLSF